MEAIPIFGSILAAEIPQSCYPHVVRLLLRNQSILYEL